MKVITKIEYTFEEINTIINALKLADAISNDSSVIAEMQLQADDAFRSLTNLLKYDPEGEKAWYDQGW